MAKLLAGQPAKGESVEFFYKNNPSKRFLGKIDKVLGFNYYQIISEEAPQGDNQDIEIIRNVDYAC